jgi:hypothetical protein
MTPAGSGLAAAFLSMPKIGWFIDGSHRDGGRRRRIGQPVAGPAGSSRQADNYR